jgi:hypothetical protein
VLYASVVTFLIFLRKREKERVKVEGREDGV